MTVIHARPSVGPLAEILAQHAELQAIMTRCETLAAEVDAGREVVAVLVREVARLRGAFKAHNRAEQRLIEAIGRERVWRVDHVPEPVPMQVGPPCVTGDLRAAIATIRAHLELEERALIEPR